MQSDEEQKRDAAVDLILNQRATLILHLISALDPDNKDQHSEDARTAAAYLLGELRAAEAVGVLSRALADQPGREVIDDLSRYDFPVCTALVKIGRPAMPAMVQNIQNSDSEVLRNRSLDVLRTVLGGKGELLFLLEKLERQATQEDILSRLRAAEALVKSRYVEVER